MHTYARDGWRIHVNSDLSGHAILRYDGDGMEVAFPASVLAEVVEAATESLRVRQGELLALVRRISQEAPLPEEANELRSQVAALLAEVGTLRSRLSGL